MFKAGQSRGRGVCMMLEAHTPHTPARYSYLVKIAIVGEPRPYFTSGRGPHFSI